MQDFDLGLFVLTMARVLIAFWLISSAVIRYEVAPLRFWETGARLVAGFLLITVWEGAQLFGLIMAIALIGLHHFQSRENIKKEARS